MTSVVALPDEAATAALGARLAHALEPGTVLHLRGEIGAGKTTLARALVQALLPGVRVKSPTYTLIESYAAPRFPLHHLDLYRLADPEELEHLAWRELGDDGAVVVIEWPERGGDRLPPPDLLIALQRQGEGRCAVLTAWGTKGEHIADAIT